ncbi:MAG: aminotransferase class I/II-fold pyridoxal phosphate-dependent enzyme [Acidimicrobiales bacterium]
MTNLHARPWVPAAAEALVQRIADTAASATPDANAARLDELIAWNRRIHDEECINLNPATNTMNPRAEAALSSGLGSRPSLGYPGDKYEMGLEAIEAIEVMAAELAAEVFDAHYAEVRVPSGAMANLFGFMATTSPGDAIIASPAAIAGHVTHHQAGVAGLYHLDTHDAPFDAARYVIDVDALAMSARELRPKVITVGASLNLFHHPVSAIREIADEIGAVVLFDAAHLGGVIAGGAWPNPLVEGAHLMTMSTYKSLGGPPSGLLLTNDSAIAERVDAIAYPGLTANFDAAKTAALAITMLDWQTHGTDYAAAMVATAQSLVGALSARGVPIFAADFGGTESHAFAVDARHLGGGHAAAVSLRERRLLASAIGLPTDTAEASGGGLRLGMNEMARWGMTPTDMPELADLIARGLDADSPAAAVADDVSAMRRRFSQLHYVRS